MYVPAFPLVSNDLGVSATGVQLTLTTFFVGMALGQLVGGPVSDQRGRRGPLLASLVVMVLASVVCAISPTIGVMLVARFVQGFSGGWAMVIARSLVVDLAAGSRLVKTMNVVQGVAGIAPIVGPLLGAVILQLSHWRARYGRVRDPVAAPGRAGASLPGAGVRQPWRRTDRQAGPAVRSSSWPPTPPACCGRSV